MQQYTRDEVKEHNDRNSIWIVLHNNVYDVTSFIHEHPGGEELLLDRAGCDATDCFDTVGHTMDAKELRKKFKIGEIVESERLEKLDDKNTVKQEPVNILEVYVIPAIIIAIAFYYFFY